MAIHKTKGNTKEKWPIIKSMTTAKASGHGIHTMVASLSQFWASSSTLLALSSLSLRYWGLCFPAHYTWTLETWRNIPGSASQTFLSATSNYGSSSLITMGPDPMMMTVSTSKSLVIFLSCGFRNVE